jgi:rhodanese-related sulfurtransferase
MSYPVSIPQRVSAAPRQGQGGCISVETARLKVAAGAIVIDVRSDYDYEKYGSFEYENDGRTETAVNIPVATIGKSGGQDQLPLDREYVLICQMGQCSKTAMSRLAELGINSYSVDGGISAWKKSHR